MKIAIVNTMAPFVWGGAEELAIHLALNLRRLGHDADLIRIPFAWEPYERITTEMVRCKAITLQRYDQVISMKFPVYLMETENHSTWLIHQYRQAYDLWDSPYCNIPHTIEGEALRQLIVEHDSHALSNRQRLFTISDEISSRLRINNGIEASPLRAPLNDPELFTGGPCGNYILAPGRINATKRQSLLVEAMSYMPADARLIVAGPPESEQDATNLRRLVEERDLHAQVKLDLRFLERGELASYVNGSRAVAYLPFQEDSYGYCTMEAFEAAKPVITVKDAVELLDIVHDGQTGRVCNAAPEELAEAMSSYLCNSRVASDHGRRAREVWRATGISWPDNIARLLGSVA